MKVKKEIREERNDVFGFYIEEEIIGVNGSVIVEKKVAETTEISLLEQKTKLENDLALINEKLNLIQNYVE